MEGETAIIASLCGWERTISELNASTNPTSAPNVSCPSGGAALLTCVDQPCSNNCANEHTNKHISSGRPCQSQTKLHWDDYHQRRRRGLLPENFHCQLNLAWQVDLCADYPCCPVTKVCIGRAKCRMVKQVECFRTKLGAHIVVNRN